MKNKQQPLRDPKAKSIAEPDSALTPIFIGAILGHLIAPGIGGVAVGGLLGSAINSSNNKEKRMAKIPVFYSFHFDNDVMRVQQVRNIGSIEGNSPTTPNEWERLKRSGDAAVEKWIDENMKYKRCVVVLIGSQTSTRPWVEYEIRKAWNDGKALLGIYIHNLKCPRGGICGKGNNPFDELQFNDGRKLSSVITCYDPDPINAYQDIASNISYWISHAIASKQN